jgi:hypothetical protein
VIDFANRSVFKLSQAKPDDIAPAVAPLIIEGEQIVTCFKAVRDFVVFTNKRLIAVNVQGLTARLSPSWGRSGRSRRGVMVRSVPMG